MEDSGETLTLVLSNASGAGFASFGREAVGTIWNTETAATGAPTISGTAQVGETLTADTSGIADADGLENVTFSYQWLSGDSDISGATGSAYTLADADEGKAIAVQVSFTDDAGNDESLTSAATDAVAGNEEPVAREDAAAWSATMTVEWVYQGYGYYSTDTKKAGSLTPASFEVDGTTYTVKMVETQGWWTYIGTDRELPFDFVLELDGTRFERALTSNPKKVAAYAKSMKTYLRGTNVELTKKILNELIVQVRIRPGEEKDTATVIIRYRIPTPPSSWTEATDVEEMSLGKNTRSLARIHRRRGN